jgi:hypothetical protein
MKSILDEIPDKYRDNIPSGEMLTKLCESTHILSLQDYFDFYTETPKYQLETGTFTIPNNEKINYGHFKNQSCTQHNHFNNSKLIIKV